MLYKFHKEQVEKVPFHNIKKVSGNEKDLENLLANHLQDFFSNPVLMPIFQERKWQEEPDLMALDENGTLYIFELKVGFVSDKTVLQIIRYAQKFGVESYAKLDHFYQQWCKTTGSPYTDLKIAHKDAFQLDSALPESQFNCRQKLILVGNTADSKLAQAVQYWQEKGLEIGFMKSAVKCILNSLQNHLTSVLSNRINRKKAFYLIPMENTTDFNSFWICSRIKRKKSAPMEKPIVLWIGWKKMTMFCIIKWVTA